MSDLFWEVLAGVGVSFFAIAWVMLYRLVSAVIREQSQRLRELTAALLAKDANTDAVRHDYLRRVLPAPSRSEPPKSEPPKPLSGISFSHGD